MEKEEVVETEETSEDQAEAVPDPEPRSSISSLWCVSALL